MKRIVFLLVVILCLPRFIFAEENISMQDKMIGSTFKTLAKAFVAVVDINKLKKGNIDKVNRMKEDKFQKHYAKAYAVLKDLPAQIKTAYKITGQMSKEQAILDIQALDKPKLYGAIDSIPDTFIARQFKLYLNQKKQEIQKTNLAVQINNLWNKIIARAPN